MSSSIKSSLTNSSNVLVGSRAFESRTEHQTDRSGSGGEKQTGSKTFRWHTAHFSITVSYRNHAWKHATHGRHTFVWQSGSLSHWRDRQLVVQSCSVHTAENAIVSPEKGLKYRTDNCILLLWQCRQFVILYCKLDKILILQHFCIKAKLNKCNTSNTPIFWLKIHYHAEMEAKPPISYSKTM